MEKMMNEVTVNRINICVNADLDSYRSVSFFQYQKDLILEKLKSYLNNRQLRDSWVTEPNISKLMEDVRFIRISKRRTDDPTMIVDASFLQLWLWVNGHYVFRSVTEVVEMIEALLFAISTNRWIDNQKVIAFDVDRERGIFSVKNV